jgi:hypothetical protein
MNFISPGDKFNNTRPTVFDVATPNAILLRGSEKPTIISLYNIPHI